MSKFNNTELQRVVVAAIVTVTAVFAWQYLTKKTATAEFRALADVQIAEQVDVSTKAMIAQKEEEAQKVEEKKAKVVAQAAQEAVESPVAVETPNVPTVEPEPVVEPVEAVQSISEAEAKAFIYTMESGNNPGAINVSSGACGLGQALPCSKMPCSLSDYTCQDAYFTTYAMQRYGSWVNAAAYWRQAHWW